MYSKNSCTKILLVIVPGFGSKGLEWQIATLPGYLNEQGVATHCFRNFDSGRCDIRHNGRKLANELAQLPADIELFLLGHSMGGLVARAALQHALPVKGLITLATPHQGTYTAMLAPWAHAARQMRPASKLLQELDNNKPTCPVFSISCKFDEIVLPNSFSIMPGSTRTSVVPSLHAFPMLWQRSVAKQCVDFINEINRC